MQKCPDCQTENEDRNYYCRYCGKPLKGTTGTERKKLQHRYDYLVDLNMVEDNSFDIDYFIAYRSKKKK